MTRSFKLRPSLLLCLAAMLAWPGGTSPLHAADAPDLLEPKKMLETLPRDLVKNMDSKGDKSAQAIQEANKKFADAFNGKPGTLSFKLTRIVQYEGAYNVFSEAERVRVAGTEFTIFYELHLTASENDKAAKLRPGSKITAGGTPFVQITNTNGFRLIITIRGATFK